MSLPPILCYHKVDLRRELGVTRLAPRVFRRQMEALARVGVRTVGSAELERLVGADGAVGAAPGSRGRLAPHRSLRPSHPAPLTRDSPLVLTFDDAYAALDEHAFPVLADLGFTALVFAITDFVGRENRWDVGFGLGRFPHLSWDQLARWRERGVIEVHSHGATHARLTWLSDAALDEELERSSRAIRERLGSAPSGLCYPYAAADRRVVDRTRAAGYRLGFAGPRAVPHTLPADAPLVLARRPVYAWDSAAVPLVLRGGGVGRAGMAAASLANRLSVLTAGLGRLSRRG